MKLVSDISRWPLRIGWLALLLATASCGSDGVREQTASTPPRTAAPRSSENSPPLVRPATDAQATPLVPAAETIPASQLPANQPPAEERPASEPKRVGLADLVEEGKRREFELAPIDEARAKAAGLRKITGQHLELWTDLPVENRAVDALPANLDLAVQQFAQYFGLDAAQVDAWRVRGFLIGQRGPFEAVDLLPPTLPDFKNGFARGSEFWLYDQPSDYYRQHLLFHEAVHVLMNRLLGGSGPPWYMEGVAEFLATHRTIDGKIVTAAMPQHRDEVPLWGRTKIIRDGFAEGKGMTLEQIFRYDGSAHLRNEPYGWCWGAAAFLDAHPLTQAKFRKLKSDTTNRTLEFSEQLEQSLASDWPVIATDWQLFVIDCDYGYDFARSAIVVRDAVDLPADGATVIVAADRSFQSSGYRLEAGKSYEITATGTFQVKREAAVAVMSEPDGITLEYHRQQPLGRLSCAVADLPGSLGGVTPLADEQVVGRQSIYTPKSSGPVYFRINEASSGLADNRGELSVTIKLAN